MVEDERLRKMSRHSSRAIEKFVHELADPTCLFGLVDLRSQLAAVTNAVSEIRSKLFHLAGRLNRFLFLEHAVIGAHDFVAIQFRGLEILTRRYIFLNLAENPRV